MGSSLRPYLHPLPQPAAELSFPFLDLRMVELSSPCRWWRKVAADRLERGPQGQCRAEAPTNPVTHVSGH